MNPRIIILTIGLIIPHTLIFSQNTYEKTYNGQTYVFDRESKIVANKNNKIQSESLSYDCRVGVSQPTPVEDIYRKVFSKERLNDFRPSSISIACVCDSEGRVLEMYFKLRDNIDIIKVSEIQMLESLLKDYKFELSISCPEQEKKGKAFRIFLSCHFRNLY